MYYLAYGMNTSRDAMAVRCPKAKPMGGFYLPSHRLVFFAAWLTSATIPIVCFLWYCGRSLTNA